MSLIMQDDPEARRRDEYLRLLGIYQSLQIRLTDDEWEAIKRFYPAKWTGEAVGLGRPIDCSVFSVRARKCLKRFSIATLGELIRHSSKDLLKARNFGRTTLEEIQAYLRGLGLHLRDDTAE